MESLDHSKSYDIDGLEFYPRKIIAVDDGDVCHMIRADDACFDGNFGEVYFSNIKPRAIKGWKYHRQQVQRFTVPRGSVEFVLFDDRTDSPTKGHVCQVTLDQKENYGLLIVPSRIWYGFRCLSREAGLIVNCASIPHDVQESTSMPLSSPYIPYRWAMLEGDERQLSDR